jgi:predicted dehydrogenase
MSRKLRFGVLSTAKIGVDKVIPAMQQAAQVEVTAIASRSAESARAAAAKLGIPHAFASYEELLASNEVDAIYNPLPNHLHVEWSIKALQAGKHVLCEKPIGLTAAEGQQLVDAAAKFPQLKVMEAFMYRHHPQWQRAKAIVHDGGVGELRTVQSFFSYYNDDATNIRNRVDAGGGALMDIGCYCISLSRFIFDAEPNRVLGRIEIDPRFGTDVLSSGILEFGNRTATFTCGTLLAPFQRVQIVGTKGRVEIEIPFNAPHDKPCRLWHQHERGTEEISFPVCNQYTIQADLFAQAVLTDKPVPTPLPDAVANMRVIEAIVRSAQQSDWQPV